MVYFLFYAIVFAVVSAIVANTKGRNPIAWFFLGFLFGIFALIVIFVLPKIEVAKTLAEVAKEKNEFKTCPDCAEVIAKMARVCKHCGKRFDDEIEELLKNREAEEAAFSVMSNEAALATLREKGITEINEFNDNNLTPLMEFAMHNDKDMVGLLLKAGANKNERNMAGFTAADKAEREGHIDLANFIRNY